MDGGLLPELLCQVVEPLQPADLVQQPLLVALLGLLQVLPAVVDVLWGQERARLHGGWGTQRGSASQKDAHRRQSSRPGSHVALLRCACTGPRTKQVRPTPSG